jgi:hypothetical protein
MPPVAAAVAGYAVSSALAAIPLGVIAGSAAVGLASIGVTSALVGSLAGGIVSMGLNQITGSMMGGKKKSAPNLGSDLQTGIKQVVRQSDDTYKLIYGMARVGGTVAYAESTSAGNDSNGTAQTGDNLFLHMIIIHAGHEVNSFEEVYLNDDLVTLNASGFVQEAPYMKDSKSYVRIIHHDGAVDQTADSVLVSEVTNWTTNHRLRGLAYTYMRLQWDGEVFTSGIPNLNVVIKGKKVYDPRLATTDYGSIAEAATTTVDDGSIATAPTYVVDDGSIADLITSTQWSDNAALCIRDYLTSRDASDLPYGFGATADEINDTFTIAAANICDELIAKNDATTVARYTINGVVDTSATPLDNLEAMITACAGAVTYPNGKFRIHAGAYDTPETDVIDESWLAGNIKSRNRVARQDLFNAVRGTYIAPNKGWQKDDFPAITSAVYEAEDNDERIYTDIELPYTTDPEAAQRIAKIAQRKGREQISVSMTCNYRALQFTVWDVVKVNNTNRGWSEKIFRIVGLTFDIRGGVNLELREENSASYDWTASDAEAVASAPDTNLPSPFIVDVPTGVAFDSRVVDTLGGDSIYNLVMSWELHNNAFVRAGGNIEIQFKLSADSEWRPSFSVNGTQTSADIVSTAVNISYDLRIRAVNMLGRASSWVTILNAVVGTSGGVGSTEDWGEWVSAPGTSDDFGEWVSSPGTTDDWGFFT